MSSFQSEVARIIGSDMDEHQANTWSFVALNVQRDVAAYEPDTPVEAASANKLPIAHALAVAKVPLDQMMCLEETDIKDENGILQYVPPGHELPLGEALRLMLSISDNTAARVCARAVGGPLKIMEILRSDSPLREKIPNTFLQAKDPSDASPEAPFYYGSTTAMESALILQEVLATEPGRAALSRGNFAGGLRYNIDPVQPAKHHLIQRIIARLASKVPLPASGYDKIIGMQLPETKYPNKEGTNIERTYGMYADVGRIGNFDVAVFCNSKEPLAKRGERHHSRHVQAALGQLTLSRSHR